MNDDEHSIWRKREWAPIFTVHLDPKTYLESSKAARVLISSALIEVRCWNCGGLGYEKTEEDPCPWCRGEGMLYEPSPVTPEK